MPNLAGFAALARKVGVVPRVPQRPIGWGTDRGTDKSYLEQILKEPVPLVPHVPLEMNDAWDEEDWRAAFEERAAILEYDEGLPRAEAEMLAREQIIMMVRKEL